MNTIRILFNFIWKAALFLLFLVIAVIIAWAVYIQCTKPDLPSFEMLKKDLLVKINATPDEWVTFDELPKELSQFEINRIDHTFWEPSSWIDVTGSRVCFNLFSRFVKQQGNVQTRDYLLRLIDQLGYVDWHTVSKSKIKNQFYYCSLNVDLDRQWTKQQQLEIYFNSIYMGLPDKNGIYNAAHFYFEKQPKDLTPSESAILHALQISPGRLARTKEVEQSACTTLKENAIPQAEKLCEALPELVQKAVTQKNEYIESIQPQNEK